MKKSQCYTILTWFSCAFVHYRLSIIYSYVTSLVPWSCLNLSYLYPNMALWSEKQWTAQLQDSGIPTVDATRYTKMFHKCFTNEILIDLTKSDLIDLGDIKIILHLDLLLLTPQLQQLNHLNISQVPSLWKLLQPNHHKFTEMIHSQLHKFKMDCQMSLNK